MQPSFLHRYCFFCAEGQINQRNIWCWNTNSHTCQLSVQFWNYFSNSLCWSINSQLVGGCSMDGCHETFHNSEFIVNYLCKWSKAVCGTRSVGVDGCTIVFLIVYSHNPM